MAKVKGWQKSRATSGMMDELGSVFWDKRVTFEDIFNCYNEVRSAFRSSYNPV